MAFLKFLLFLSSLWTCKCANVADVETSSFIPCTMKGFEEDSCLHKS
jgi:hypothetical protein